jgi:hypothetical protein
VDILTIVARLLSGLNVTSIESRAVSWLREQGETYPDLAAKTDALAAWISQTIAEATPNLDPSVIANTAKGIAQDIMNGTAGTDPGAWQGGA